MSSHSDELDCSVRSVQRVDSAHKTLEGAGFPVYRLPHMPDPLLMLDEFGPINYGPGEAKGAPHHPHRGFITVSYILSGEMQHEDSMGNRGVLRAGDCQFMTAGSGVIHDERPTPEFLASGGLMHGFQIWVNLPARFKMIDPDYQDVAANTIPSVDIESGGAIKVIAGRIPRNLANPDHEFVVGPVRTHTPITYLDVTINAGSHVKLDLDRSLNVLAYVIEGEGLFGDERRTAASHVGVLFNRDGRFIVVAASDNQHVRFLLLAAEPIGEPVAQRGPFVMNTNEEIRTAFEEYYAGTFIKAKGRFLHPTNE